MRQKKRSTSAWQYLGFTLTSIIIYVVLGQFTRQLPNPMLPQASLALNMVVPVIVGYFQGSVAGAVVGALGTLLNFLFKTQAYGDLDLYEVVAILPHALMGAAAGWPRLKHTRIGAASTVLVGHLLNIMVFLFTGLLAFTALRDPLFLTGLVAEALVDLIIITLCISLIHGLQGKEDGFAWKRLEPPRFWLIGGMNLALLLVLVVAYLHGVPLAIYLFIMPVIFSSLTLGFLEAWVIVFLLSALLGSVVLRVGLDAATQEISLILTLNLVALAMGELVENVREQRRLAQTRLLELQQAYSVLAENDCLKDQMIQNVSHELRTPLSMILGYTELLSTDAWGALSEEQQDAAQVIRRNARQLSKIVEKITVLDQVQLGQMTRHPTSLDSLSRILVESKQPWASEHACTFVFQSKNRIPHLTGDARYLGRAIEALLDNAVKFSPDGGTIIVKTWADEERVYLTVRDRGIGISETAQKRLFERFYQVDGSTTRRFGGVGAGLALVKEVIQAHGGDVWVESTPNEGSEFGLWLPLQPDWRAPEKYVPIFV